MAKKRKKAKKKPQPPAQHPNSSIPSPGTTKNNCQIKSYQAVEATLFAGPLPHPQILEEYDRVVPGAAKQILDTFERQSNHRMEIEKIVITAGARDSLLGIISAFLVAALTIGCGTYIALQGYQIGGTLLGGSGLGALIGAFLYGSKQRRLERERKFQLARKFSQNGQPRKG